MKRDFRENVAKHIAGTIIICMYMKHIKYIYMFVKSPVEYSKLLNKIRTTEEYFLITNNSNQIKYCC